MAWAVRRESILLMGGILGPGETLYGNTQSLGVAP